ncbi:MAG TPA: alpha-L-fucosidase [Chthoniobacteraceae bacterium]|nr:alpha-L-fucosidase [Chthoniobacteraceae bacterium]
MTTEEFTQARYGMFVHFGLYSMLGRGEWAFNREEIPRGEYRALADRFHPDRFDAGVLADLAVAAGMRYLVFTTMHHDGFRLYHSELTDFCSTKTACGRDFTAEIIAACRQRGLKVGLYHSLNNWFDRPDAVEALENENARERFLENTFARLRELVTRYQPVDLLWYDGWWPFDAEGWKAREMNAMVRAIQPHILFNGRNGLAGDFSTPEGHLSAPTPWRPWEACITLNESWGYSVGDDRWKTAKELLTMLARCAAHRGNLLLNVGPKGDGRLPRPTEAVLREAGAWLESNREAIFDTDLFTWDLREKGEHRSDWNHLGPLTARGNAFHWLIFRWPGSELTLGGVASKVERVSLLEGGQELSFRQSGTRLRMTAPQEAPSPLCTVLKIECSEPPRLYQSGGLRTPAVPHPHYDPVASDIAP